MECLTSRLTLMMNQGSENRMVEINDQDRFEKQRLKMLKNNINYIDNINYMDCQQRSRSCLYDKNYPYYNIKEHRRLSLERRQCDGSSSYKKKDEQAKEQIAKGKKFKKISFLLTIWRHRPAREQKESVKDDIEKTGGSNKFLETAKMAAIISSVEFENICTGSSLDATCDVHGNYCYRCTF